MARCHEGLISFSLVLLPKLQLQHRFDFFPWEADAPLHGESDDKAEGGGVATDCMWSKQMFVFTSFSIWEAVADESQEAAAEVRVGVDIATLFYKTFILLPKVHMTIVM